MGGLENTYMGLGADNIPCELDNSWSDNERLNSLVKAMFSDALEKFFSDIGGFDFKVVATSDSFDVLFGYEPAYQHEPYIMCRISSAFGKCRIQKGVAKGFYGTDVWISYDMPVTDKDCDDVFKDFVIHWYPLLLNCLSKEGGK
jgi:hypothetical protein